MKYLPILFVFFTLTGCLSQAPETKDPFNLDLEVINQGTPVGWRNNQDYATGYLFSLDSTDVHHGKYAISLEYKTTEGIDFGSWSMMIPQRYEGKKITLSGYIKTENVNGYAGLWMRLDPNVALENMSSHGIKGSSAWKKYSITLPLEPSKTERIVIGGILQGSGKA